MEKELTPYCCSVTNANISELRDTPGEDNGHFETLETEAVSAAAQEPRSVLAWCRSSAPSTYVRPAVQGGKVE